jgi:predicted NAD-dependent protein-ADP-ribosyltransferase YbiA (DUF1768 family)
MLTRSVVFYSKSADGKPGKNKGKGWQEQWDGAIPIELTLIPDWRRMLSNFDDSVPFVFEGFTFNTIEHAFQYKKIALADKEKAFLFTRESDSPLGLGSGQDAQKARKLVRLSSEQLLQWDAISGSVMAAAAAEKYLQNQTGQAAAVLRYTGDAELYHLVTARGQPSALVRFHHLEHIRKYL